MQIYTRKLEQVRMSKWDGGTDEQVVQELRDLGFIVNFQTSPVPTERDWDDDKGVEVEVPALGRMCISGKYNWDTWHFAPGHYIVFSLVNKLTGAKVEWTDENLADDDNKIHLRDRDPGSVDKGFDLVG